MEPIKYIDCSLPENIKAHIQHMEWAMSELNKPIFMVPKERFNYNCSRSGEFHKYQPTNGIKSYTHFRAYWYQEEYECKCCGHKITGKEFREIKGISEGQYKEFIKDHMSEKERIANDIIVGYENKTTRPLGFNELCLMLARFQIMLEEEPNRYSIEEFIQQEDYRRILFSK